MGSGIDFELKDAEAVIAICHEQDYISLTDMVRNLNGDGALIERRLRNNNAVSFLGVWEQLNNADFNFLEFGGIENEAGRNSFFLSAKKRTDATGAIDLGWSLQRALAPTLAPSPTFEEARA